MVAVSGNWENAMAYEAPAMTVLGSLHEVTLQTTITKNGEDADIFSTVAPLLGSAVDVVPPPAP